ncbi:MAG TPA: hypothetical protein DC058_19550 [Planctomycetaceae bacterium]|nr:hypothetical protein [Planctomycetaceae bacterium]
MCPEMKVAARCAASCNELISTSCRDVQLSEHFADRLGLRLSAGALRAVRNRRRLGSQSCWGDFSVSSSRPGNRFR